MPGRQSRTAKIALIGAVGVLLLGLWLTAVLFGGVWLLLRETGNPAVEVPAEVPLSSTPVEERPRIREQKPAALAPKAPPAPRAPEPAARIDPPAARVDPVEQPAPEEPPHAEPPRLLPDRVTRTKMDEADQLIAEEMPTPEGLVRAAELADEVLAQHPEWDPALFVAAVAACGLKDPTKARALMERMTQGQDGLRERCSELGVGL